MGYGTRPCVAPWRIAATIIIAANSVVLSEAKASSDHPVLRAMLEQLKSGESMLAEAGPRGDTVGMQLVSWQSKSNDAYQATGKPEHLPKAFDRCATAQLVLGDVADTMMWVVFSGREHISRRSILDGFIDTYADIRAVCARDSGVDLGRNPLARAAEALLPSRPRIGQYDDPLPYIAPSELRESFKALTSLEAAMDRAASKGDRLALLETVAPIHQYILRHELLRYEFRFSSGVPAIDEACSYVANSIFDLNNGIGYAMFNRNPTTYSAKYTLPKYRTVKAACARALGLPSVDGLVAIEIGALGSEQQ